MMILDHYENSQKRRKPIPEIETPRFWAKIGALAAVKNRKDNGMLMPAYDPKKLFPEHFASPEEREKMERQKEAQEEYKDIQWQSPSETADDWKKTEAMLNQLNNMTFVDPNPSGVQEEPTTPEGFGPPEAVERFATPEQSFTEDDLNWT